jgi:ribosomal protein S18 acetylase RimI-like enzyme
MLIRNAVGSDAPYCYEICLKTGYASKDATGFFYDPYLLGQYYAAPYLFYDTSLCFVAEEGGLPQGYIIAAQDTPAFNQWMEQVWLPPLRRRYPQPYPAEKTLSNYEATIIELFHRRLDVAPPWVADFPAHLHIDLLPPLQGRGVGRSLMNTLFAALEQRGCQGVHLGVSKVNTGAIAFYHKMGFTQLDENDYGLTLGKKLAS